MKKIGYLLLISGITIISFYYVYKISLNEREKDDVSDYIQETSMKEEVIDEENINIEDTNIEENSEIQQTSINLDYTAVIEIPKINLKRGVINSTKNFNSVNYAISVDENSNYPNEMGNFILYAHSGNSSIAYFKNLNKVEVGDEVYIYYEGVKYKYIIYDKYDIQKTGKANVIKSSTDNYLTLITCNQNKKNYQIVVIGKLDTTTKY